MWWEDKLASIAKWTEEERRIKGPFFRFWVPVIFFLVVWWLIMAVFDLMGWL